MSSWHWLILLILYGLPAVCGWRIARRAGFPPALGVVMAVPLAGHILLWIWAFIRWPIETKGGAPHETRPVVR